MPGVASFLFPLKDGFLCSHLPRDFGFEAKVKGFISIVSVTEGTRIAFTMLMLLELLLPDLPKLCLAPGLVEKKGEKHIVLLILTVASKNHPSLCRMRLVFTKRKLEVNWRFGGKTIYAWSALYFEYLLDFFRI